MAMKDILLLGDPELLNASEPVLREELTDAIETGRDLSDTMSAFRGAAGWGRAISAPQIGVRKRIIYLNVDQPWLVINPKVSDLSDEMIEIGYRVAGKEVDNLNYEVISR